MLNWPSFYTKHHPSEITQEASQPLRRHGMMSRVASDHVIYASEKKGLAAKRVCFLHMLKFRGAEFESFRSGNPLIPH